MDWEQTVRAAVQLTVDLVLFALAFLLLDSLTDLSDPVMVGAAAVFALGGIKPVSVQGDE